MLDNAAPGSAGQGLTKQAAHRLARLVLTAFLCTFILARIVVLLIMTRRLPDLYLHVGGTHVHHLNYGILVLSGIGAYLLFRRPVGRELSVAAVLYGIGLALTFDEFGMWLRLGGSYWTRASFDAIVIIAAMLGLIAFAPVLKKFRPRHWAIGLAIAIAVAIFVVLLGDLYQHAGRIVGPELRRIESSSPP
jgi:hypothetical protein